MSTSKITILGLEEYLRDTGKSLFDNMKLPEGIDKEILCDNILQRGSEFEVEYPNADYMRSSIGVWSRKWYWTFNKWLVAISTEYKPLENYDRYEDWTDNNKHNDTINNTHNDTDNINSSRDINGGDTLNTSSTLNTTANSSDHTSNDMITTETTENLKSAYDSGGYSPYEKTERTASSDNTIDTTHTETGNNQNIGNETGTHNEKDTYTEGRSNNGGYKNIQNGDYETIHTGHLHGNIGVTSAQDMLRQEIDIAYFNLYDRITDIFINEYCIPIYI